MSINYIYGIDILTIMPILEMYGSQKIINQNIGGCVMNKTYKVSYVKSGKQFNRTYTFSNSNVAENKLVSFVRSYWSKKIFQLKISNLTNNIHYDYVGKIHLKLKTTTYKMNNDLSVMVAWFKNLKKLKQHHFEGEVFNAQLKRQQYYEMEAA